MWSRRIFYLVSLVGCFFFYVLYQEWFSWFLLVLVTALPWFSLLLSLPAMLCTKWKLSAPVFVTMGERYQATVTFSCPLPLPLVTSRLTGQHSFIEQTLRYRPQTDILAEHSGMITLRLDKLRIYDYLGLFCWRFSRAQTASLYVLPTPVVVEHIPSLSRYLASGWKPKAYGFSEHHDLRQYREGDDLRQIHWKLSAKTGKLILREPIVPVRGKLVLTMLLQGDPMMLDEKLGKLLYISRHLLEKELSHQIHCLTGDGLLVLDIASEDDLHRALITILESTPTTRTDMPQANASWQYRIGGVDDEA